MLRRISDPDEAGTVTDLAGLAFADDFVSYPPIAD